MISPLLFYATGSWLFLILGAQAALVNVTIDDKYGDPKTGNQVMYSPPDSWNDGTNCSACTARPDPAMPYLNTWHDGSYLPPPNSSVQPVVQTLSVPFNGSAVHIYCITANTVDSPDGNSDMTFSIDNETVGTYVHPPTGTGPKYTYNVNVYSNTSVPPGQHTISVRNGLVTDSKSLIILDYITYSYDDGTDEPSSKHMPPPGIIAAAVICGILAFALVVGTTFFVLRRRRRRFLADAKVGMRTVEAFPEGPPPSTARTTAISFTVPTLLSVTPSTPGRPSPVAQIMSPNWKGLSSSHVRSSPSQEGLLNSEDQYGYGSVPVASSSSSASASRPPEIRDKEKAKWNAFLTPELAQPTQPLTRRELPPIPIPSGPSSASYPSPDEPSPVFTRTYDLPLDDPPAYETPKEPVFRVGGLGQSFSRPPMPDPRPY